MAESKGRQLWNQTSLLAALIYNTHRRPRSPGRSAEFYNPYSERVGQATPAGIPINADNIHLLKCLVPKHKRPQG